MTNILEILEKKYKALRLIKSNKYEEANTIFDDLLVISPNRIELWYYKGIVYSQTNRIEDALSALSKAQGNNSIKEKVLLKKAILYYKQDNLSNSIDTLNMITSNGNQILLLFKEWVEYQMLINQDNPKQEELLKTFINKNHNLLKLHPTDKEITNNGIEDLIQELVEKQEQNNLDHDIKQVLAKASKMVNRTKKCC
ncbi:MAG: tetratricopeptide repeat protein [Candidatus Kariarchaeaceae archaeon]|jgi:tetratricopeptide (TPR) repeat protein